MNRRRKRVPRVATLVVVLLLGSSTVFAEDVVPRLPIWHITGVVRDARGNLADRAGVGADGTDVTGPDGRYYIQQLGFGTYQLTASRVGESSHVEVVSLTVFNPNEERDLTMFYVANIFVSSAYVSPADGSVFPAVRVASFSPNPGFVGEVGADCVRFVDLDGAVHYMTFQSSDPWGRGTWLGNFEVSPDHPDGLYKIHGEVVDCGTFQVLQLRPLVASVVVDATAPEIVRVADVVAQSGELVVDLLDKTSGINPVSLQVLVDGQPAGEPVFTYEWETGITRGRVPLGELALGAHEATIEVKDRAGNRISGTASFSVDDGAPLLSDPAPTGSVGSSPEISIAAADAHAGVDGASVTMTISNGIVTELVPATFDAGTERVRYRVPDQFEGARLGRFPLPPGPYTVRVTVADLVGNSASHEWTFVVGPGP